MPTYFPPTLYLQHSPSAAMWLTMLSALFPYSSACCSALAVAPENLFFTGARTRCWRPLLSFNPPTISKAFSMTVKEKQKVKPGKVLFYDHYSAKSCPYKKARRKTTCLGRSRNYPTSEVGPRSWELYSNKTLTKLEQLTDNIQGRPDASCRDPTHCSNLSFAVFIRLNELSCRTQKPYLPQNTSSSAQRAVSMLLFETK
jgi:hypothetical protein